MKCDDYFYIIAFYSPIDLIENESRKRFVESSKNTSANLTNIYFENKNLNIKMRFNRNYLKNLNFFIIYIFQIDSTDLLIIIVYIICIIVILFNYKITAKLENIRKYFL